MKNKIFIFIGIILSLISCCNQATPNAGITGDVFRVDMQCYPGDRNDSIVRLRPFEVYFSINMTNNTGDTIEFGTSNHKYGKTKKYGFFQLIYEKDTIDLYSRYDSCYPLVPKQTMDFSLYYESTPLFGKDILIDMLSIYYKKTNSSKYIFDMKSVCSMREAFDSIKIRYVPLTENKKLSYAIYFSSNLEISYSYAEMGISFFMNKENGVWTHINSYVNK